MTHNNKGENNPRWKGGGSAGYILRVCKGELLRHNRDITHCDVCGKPGELKAYSLDIHHIDKNIQNNTNKNLRVICRNCHVKEHWKGRCEILENKLVECGCGCGEKFLKYSKYSKFRKERKFKHGHHLRLPQYQVRAQQNRRKNRS